MLRSVAVSRIQRRLGFRSDLESVIIDELQHAQVTLEEEYRESPPWFLLEEISSASTEADEERLPLPTDFLQEYDHGDGALYVYDSSEDDPWIELPKGLYKGLKGYYVTSGRPKAYSLLGSYFRLHPTPDAVYSMKLLYYKRGVVLDSDVENVWLQHAPDVLINLAGTALATSIRDQGAFGWFSAQYEKARAAMHRASVARASTNRRMIKGDNT